MTVNLRKIESIAKGYFRQGLACHDWDHVERVRNLAKIIGQKERADLAVVETAVLLHDIKRAEESAKRGPFCHALEGAKEAEKILTRLGLPQDFIGQVKHCIEAHRFRNNVVPRTKEAKVLSDADKLDALGAVGVGRGFLWSGKHGLRLHNPDPKVIRRNNPHSREHSLYAEYMVKLRFLKDRMFTKTGRQLAQERTKFLADFLARLDQEIKGKL